MDEALAKYIEDQPKFGWRRFLMRGLVRTVGYTFLADASSEGLENIPQDEACIVMMSHISAIDPVICLGEITNRYVIPMTKIENMDNYAFRFLVWWWGAYAVQRDTVDRKALMTSIELLRANQLILIAPEGTRHPQGLGEGKDGIAYIATKTDAVILPAAISHTVDFKKRWKKLQRARAHVTFGKPFRFKTDGRTHIPRDEIRQMTQESMYQLALTQPDESLRGVYRDVENATTDKLIFV